MDALAKLTDLYQQRDNITKQIEAIGELLGLKQQPKEKKERQKRGPNKPKKDNDNGRSNTLPPSTL